MQQGDQHAGEGKIDGELCGAVGLCGRVDARNPLTDEFEILWILELHGVGHRQGGSGLHQRAEIRLAFFTCVVDDALVHREFRDGNLPFLGAGVSQLVP